MSKSRMEPSFLDGEQPQKNRRPLGVGGLLPFGMLTLYVSRNTQNPGPLWYSR